MIVGIGIDVIEISRIEKVFNEEKKLEKVFTEEEIRYSFSNKEPYLHLAARFCAKEAYYKCLGKGVIHFNEIETRRMENGKPYIVLYGKTKEIWENAGSPDIFVSLSHSKTVATAVVILEKKEQ
ncbi:MAG: holo-ACP synthase [Brevinematia bacterium]